MRLAAELNGVIINCDSQQIYDGLPLLSAQPSEEDKAKIPHKLYAALHPNEVCSAGNYRELAEPIIEETLEQGRTPIICGGTGLYIKALIDGLSPMPDIPDEIRNAVVARYEELGAEKFYSELKQRDPEMAARFHVNHKARLIRAMEVLEATGKSLAVWQKLERLGPPAHWRFEIHKILPEREELYRRCNERFEWMVENGALEETAEFAKRLERGEVTEGVPLTKALGFKELRKYLQSIAPTQLQLSSASPSQSLRNPPPQGGGQEWEYPIYEQVKDDPAFRGVVERAQGITRRYAKRQNTWFNNQL